MPSAANKIEPQEVFLKYMIQQLWVNQRHLTCEPASSSARQQNMRVLRGLNRLLRFLTDPDTYCLLWLATRNFIKNRAASALASAREKKHAKAVNAG